MLSEYLAWDGTEVVNNARFAAYARRIGLAVRDCDCSYLADATGGPFITPAADAAPWYDPEAPESVEFAGLRIESWQGIAKGVTTGGVVNLPSGYGALTPLKPHTREVSVTALMAASTQRGIDYGIAWLAATLARAQKDRLCVGARVDLFAACTSEPAVRRLFDAVVIEPPEITALSRRRGSCQGDVWVATVQFGFETANPFIYWTMGATVSNTFTPSQETGCEVVWHTADDCPAPVVCEGAAGCLVDPLCDPLPAPPMPPAVLDDCGCTTRFTSARAVLTADTTAPGWIEQVPVITVTTGPNDMRRLSLRFYRSDGSTPCETVVADQCNMISEVNVSYLPANATLTVDGRTRSASVLCEGGGVEPADPVLRGPGGDLFDWPVAQGDQVCIEALVDAQWYDSAATVTVSMVPRQEAG